MNFYKKVSIALALLLASDQQVQGAGYSKKWDYIFNGADWPLDPDSECSATNQSPIDLRTDMHSEPFPKANGNEFQGTYVNLVKATSLNMGKVVQVNMPDANSDGVSPNNYFTSQHSVDVLGGVKKYSAAQFHFHVKSEHTINGRRFDMEMHTVHLAQEDTRRRLAEEGGDTESKKPFASAFGLIFDRVNYDQSITPEERQAVWDFFEALDMASTLAEQNADGHDILAKEQDIPYGDLLAVVNTANRWAYSGSLTTPPCTTGVYFQVVERVLPLSEKHYKQYVALQAKHTSQDYFDKAGANQAADGTTTPTERLLSEVGNYRITNKIDNHNVHYMRAEYRDDSETDPKTITLVLAILLAVAVVLALVLGICACKLMASTKSVDQGGDEFAEGGAPVSARNNQIEMQSARSSYKSEGV